ncbi:D-glycero-beta-D-manno-heptose 1,7-bisphosphate 7-phosphatase [Paractinoplanes ferrugineus]|uniref:D,D-heptose 1,7-bisphosphate phosphatase n=1 Tax=Paractinoplanes ferrugineus TaxID=113564 RepID=A0A919J351_9ACTN|nr:HAD-IIIA family hydrolase [Actinoplanes ferrugineus]GIE13660.1 D,D-heptose 1,7-bisphosphate phosphatase [Actinoplanes ferrugineus]
MTTWSAVLLDRDGTVNVKAPEGEYVAHPDQLTLLPGAGPAVRRLRAAGIPVFVVTNQRGVARGVMTARDLEAVHERFRLLLRAAGAEVDGIYACVHERGACECRKPLPGLLHRVARDHPHVDLRQSAMVGDAAGDVAAGAAAGCVTVRLAETPDPAATVTARSLPEAVTWLLR